MVAYICVICGSHETCGHYVSYVVTSEASHVEYGTCDRKSCGRDTSIWEYMGGVRHFGTCDHMWHMVTAADTWHMRHMDHVIT